MPQAQLLGTEVGAGAPRGLTQHGPHPRTKMSLGMEEEEEDLLLSSLSSKVAGQVTTIKTQH